MKFLLSATVVMLVCGCSEEESDYEASLNCAANETFKIVVVDGLRQLAEIDETQLKFSNALMATTVVHAQSRGLNVNEANDEIKRRIDKLHREFDAGSPDEKVKMKLDTLERSQACLKRFALVGS